MRAALVTFATLFLLWALVSQLNHALTGLGVYLWVGGLFVTHAVLVSSFRSGLLAAFLGGLLLDSTAPVAFGTHALLFAAAHALLFHLRDRVPRDETTARVVIALFANLALFLVFSFLQSRHLPVPGAVWPRILLDFLSSQLFVAVAAPWFFALQSRALDLTDSFRAAYRRRFH